MSAATKKPLSNGVGRVSSSDSVSPSSSPSRYPRSSTPTSSSAGAGSTTPSRTRSVRTGTPASARAAAAQRQNSNLSSSVDANEAARAENLAVIDDLKERLAKADTSSEQYRKQADILQSRLDDALKEQARLEERVHEAEEQIESLQNGKRESARQIREMETIYEAEKSAIMKEKDEMVSREEEMQAVIQRLKDSLNQRNNGEEEYRPSRPSAHSSPSVDNGNFAPPSMQRSDSRNNSKLILQKDKLIESLRLELAEAQIKLVESENQGGGRLQEVERLLMEARMANARLMEDNESYQLLLQEKTLHGDFGKGDFSYMGGPASNQDALNALEGRSSTGAADDNGLGASLADELSEATENESENYRRLETELRAAKDQNKALTLYINKIIERLLQHQEFEHILDQSELKAGANTNKDLPAPPAKEQAAMGASLLQRAKSIAIGGGNARKPRPMSVMPTVPSGHTDPDTAPSIPIGLGRTTSVRRGGRPMSEQFIGAAGIVSQMYKGPEGPISPTLSNPRHSQSFFSNVAGSRAASGNSAPSAGNFPGMKSETSSMSGDSGELTTPPSQSPPRPSNASMSSHGHEKQTTFSGGKPRPLRLVQENENVKQEQNKRASWMGWAFGKKEEGIQE